MTPINWDEALSFGITELDDDHQTLVELVNQLEAQSLARAGREAVGATLARLVGAVGRHIEHENELLERYGYTDTADHRVLDRKFFQIFLDVQQVFEEHGVLNAETRDFIEHLIIQHILKTDAPLRQFFRKLQRVPDSNDYIHCKRREEKTHQEAQSECQPEARRSRRNNG